MRVLAALSSCLAAAALLTTAAAQPNLTESQSSTHILPSTFKPPQVWRNTNLVRTINLEKSYPRETVNVAIENVDKSPQSEYYLPFSADAIGNVGVLEVRNKNDAAQPPFKTSLVDFDPTSPTQYFFIHLPDPVTPSSSLTLSISYTLLSTVAPLPAAVAQMEKQFLLHTFSAFVPSAYPTAKQRTKLKLPTADVPSSQSLSAAASKAYSENTADPIRQGSTYSYGPFNNVPAGLTELVSVRYDFTRPLPRVASLERDLEVSHWGGNLATEERYELGNGAARIKGFFNRVKWAATQYYNPPTHALRELRLPLAPGARGAYFVDDVGNVSTSHFRGAGGPAPLLEVKPRYPVFGGWRYKFKVGWDADLGSSLRRLGAGGAYALRVPFLEGPKMGEGVQYERVVVRVILPEGATNVQYETSVPLVSSSRSLHRTFMDTLGRTTLELAARNLVDEVGGRDLVVSYDYPPLAGYRKPVTILAASLAAFGAAYLLGRVDTSISVKKTA